MQSLNEQHGISSPLELPPTRLGMSSVPRQVHQQPKQAHDTNTSESKAGNDADERKTMEIDETSTPLKAPTTSSSPGPSTSKETPSRQSSSGYNLYMQLKKKTYFDSHESDKRSEGPQDLSYSKSNADAKNAILDDSDVEMTDAEADMQSQSFDDNQHSHSGESSSSSATIRPQIIVSPRNASTFIKSSKTGDNDTATNSIVNENSSGSQTSGDNISKETSPSKSVIVRIGSSTMVSALKNLPIHYRSIF